MELNCYKNYLQNYSEPSYAQKKKKKSLQQFLL